MSNVTLETHIPILSDALPTEDHELASGRPDMPPPSLWQRAVKVVRKADNKEAVVHRIDWHMGMFRAYYPDEGRLADRTEWEHCKDWNVAVTFSPKEIERQAARKRLDEEISKLDKASLAAVSILCDDEDPDKALAKLEALRQLGVVKVSSEAAQAAVAAVNEGKKR